MTFRKLTQAELANEAAERFGHEDLLRRHGPVQRRRVTDLVTDRAVQPTTTGQPRQRGDVVNVVIKVGKTEAREESFHLDGEDIGKAVRGFTLDYEAGARPQLTLDLGVFEIDVDSDNTKLYLTDRARELLIKFGWLPPEENT